MGRNEPIAGRFKFCRYLLGWHAELRRWPLRRIDLEVDDRKPPIWPQRFSQLGEVCRAIVNVVVRVDNKNEVDRFGKVGVIRARLHGL